MAERKRGARRRLPRFRTLATIVVLVTVALVAGYFLWFKGSSLVAVEQVRITGIDVSPTVAAQLENTAIGMSTLDLDRDSLEAAVADDPAVIALKMETDFPNRLTIDVESRRPVGWWEQGGEATIAGDGVVLSDGVDRPDDLPAIEAEPPEGLKDRVSGPALTLAKVLGEAPGPLLELSERARVDDQGGPVVELQGGIELRFGNPANADAKWRAAAAVLADPELTSARYIDLSVPSRPAVG